jgi:hypothetical protein
MRHASSVTAFKFQAKSNMNKKLTRLFGALVVASMLLSSCGEEPVEPSANTPTNTPTNTPAPTAAPSTQVSAATQPAKGETTESTVNVEPTSAVPTQTAPAQVDATPAPAEGSADLGFRPQANGFSFPNYGADQPVTNLTAVEMQRMFGDQVCARIEADVCTLTPVAQQAMEQLNTGMQGGHCEGFAALSLLMYTGKIDPSQFGGSSASALQLQGNEKLQREIAYWFSTQAFNPTVSSVYRAAPKDIVAKLLASYAGGKTDETYTVGIYQPGYKAGHAITAYGVQDKGNGVYWIMVYDNNFPGQERYVEIDTHADTWQYESSINPSVQSEMYRGDAATMTLEITPSSARTGKQECNFCADSSTGKNGAGLALAADRYNEVWMDGDARLLITDGAGHKLGYEGDRFYNEIPKASAQFIKGADLNAEDVPPVYRLPVGMAFSAVLDGDNLKTKDDETALSMIGPGYYIGVEGIAMDPGEKDYLTIGGDGHSLSYKTDYEETPTIIVGVERPQADYELELIGKTANVGDEVKVEFDPDKGTMTFYSTSTDASKFDISISRYGEEDTETFEGTDLELDPNDRIILEYGQWDGQGKSLKVYYDQGGDGTVDETVDMADQK